MDKSSLLSDLGSRMDSSIKVLDNELKGLRTGRASANPLDPIQVDAYGDRTPISQLGTISTPDARTISIQVWDKGLTKAVEKAIVEANLGVNPVSDGQQIIRISIPPLSEDRRKDMVKLAYKYAENTKVALRNIRRDGMEFLKKSEKDGQISKDENHSTSELIQKLLDNCISKIDTQVKNKEQEIMSI
jgi:ribosome recycling factor